MFGKDKKVLRYPPGWPGNRGFLAGQQRVLQQQFRTG